MNDIEQHLTHLLHDRAERTAVTVDLEEVKQGWSPRPAAGRNNMALLGVAAATALVVVGGLAAIAQMRDTDSTAPAAATEPAAPTDTSLAAWPYGTLPSTGPGIADHWHMAYGFDICGTTSTLHGTLEETNADGEIVNPGFPATGIHSHDDGLIHAHPFTEAAAGEHLTLNTFLQNYGVLLTDSTLSFPADQGGSHVDETVDTCDGQPAQLVAVVWPDPAVPTEKIIVTDQLAGLPLSVDGMAITIAFTSDPDSVTMPASVFTADPTQPG